MICIHSVWLVSYCLFTIALTLKCYLVSFFDLTHEFEVLLFQLTIMYLIKVVFRPGILNQDYQRRMRFFNVLALINDYVLLIFFN